MGELDLNLTVELTFNNPARPTFCHSYIDSLNAALGSPGVIQFSEGQGGLPRVWLTHPTLHTAVEIYLHGACITHWYKPDGRDALFPDPANQFSIEQPIT